MVSMMVLHREREGGCLQDKDNFIGRRGAEKFILLARGGGGSTSLDILMELLTLGNTGFFFALYKNKHILSIY